MQITTTEGGESCRTTLRRVSEATGHPLGYILNNAFNPKELIKDIDSTITPQAIDRLGPRYVIHTLTRISRAANTFVAHTNVSK